MNTRFLEYWYEHASEELGLNAIDSEVYARNKLNEYE